MKDTWEKIDDYTFRLRTNSGWLYRYHYSGQVTIIFVPGAR